MALKCACGNETNEKDGVCVICKNPILIGGRTLRQDFGVSAQSNAQGDNCHGELVEPKGGKDMAAPKDRQCIREGCESYEVKDGLCKKHFNEVYGHKEIRSKPKCEVKGCKKQQWKDHRCMRHYNEKHGIEKHGKAGRKPKVATPATRKDNPVNPKSDNVLLKLIKERNEHRQALLEIETALKVIQHYTDTKIPELEAKSA